MKDFFLGLLLVIVILLVLSGLGWVVQGNNFFMYKYFAPKQEQVRYDVFKQSQAYNDSTAKDVADYEIQYLHAAPEQQAAIASMILQEVSSYDTTKLPPAQQAFINQLRAKQGMAQ
jgi:hypothetical protein